MEIKGITENTVDFLRGRIITGEIKPDTGGVWRMNLRECGT